MTEVTIRPEAPGDEQAISDITYAAFLNHPVHPPGALPTEHKIVEALREAGALTLSLVAELEGEIVGHAAFSRVLIDGQPRGWYGVGPICARPDRQRQGIGSALMREGIRRLKEQGAAGLVLVGDPEYYRRFGFAAHPELTMEGVPPEYVLSLPLTGEMPRGKLEFHAGFQAT